jgi:hypothetical protein
MTKPRRARCIVFVATLLTNLEGRDTLRTLFELYFIHRVHGHSSQKLMLHSSMNGYCYSGRYNGKRTLAHDL